MSRPASHHALTQRLLSLVMAGAGAGAGLVACQGRDSSTLTPVTKEAPTSPRVSAERDAGVPGARALLPATASAPLSCPEHSRLAEICLPPFTRTPSAKGTGEPGPAPAPSAFDARGCLPAGLVTDGCCNQALDGPRFQAQTCCYSVCTGWCCGRPLQVDRRPRIAGLRRAGVTGTGWG